MGFERAVSHPSLPNEEGGFDYPDFVANHRLGRWEVIEIKTPDLPVTKAPGKRRSNLRAETHDFLAQVVGYAERFADSKVREHFENAHGISIPPFPRVRLIAGGGKHFERGRIEKEIQRMSHPIEVLSYADILNELHTNRANLIGRDEGQEGLVFYFSFLPPLRSEIQKNLMVTLGPNGRLKSVEIWLDERLRIVVGIEMLDGTSRQLAVIPSVAGREHKVIGVMVEFIPCCDRTLFSIQVNGTYEASERYEITDWIPADCWPCIVGANPESGTTCNFDLAELVVFRKPLAVDQKPGFWRRMYDDLNLNRTAGFMRVRFSGNQFLRSAAHPMFSLEAGCASGDLVQPQNDCQPLSWPVKDGNKTFITRFYDQTDNRKREGKQHPRIVN